MPSEFDNPSQVNFTTDANASIDEHIKMEHSYFSTSESSTIKVENAPMDVAIITSTVESKKLPSHASVVHRVLNNHSSTDCSFAPTEFLSMDRSLDAFDNDPERSLTQGKYISFSGAPYYGEH